ncbi:MAG: hypothetical protein OXT65_09940 [Alphaproteobacteria bacterium]|nr:hypothetical protein [Alphaproteobacteria bacterium]
MIFPVLPLPVAAPPAIVIPVAAPSCDRQAPPTVYVHFKNNPPVYVHNMSSKQLDQFEASIAVPRMEGETFHRYGMLDSNTGINVKLDYRSKFWPQTNDHCVWMHEIHVDIVYEPQISLAKEMQKGSCIYNEVVQHELRHVGTDVITIREYLEPIRTATAAATKKNGIKRPVKEEAVQGILDTWKHTAFNAARSVFQTMNGVRADRQALIDTRQEYLRTGKNCPHKR